MKTNSNVLNEFMFQSHIKFCLTQWLYGSLSVYSRPLPKEKNSPLAAQLKIAFRRFLLIILNVLKPLTYESRHKLQCTVNFIDAITTKKIPNDHELLSFDVKSLSTPTPLQLAIDCSTEIAIKNSTGDLL